MLKMEVHRGEILAMNLQDFCQAFCWGKLYLGSGMFFVLLVFLMVSSGLLVTQVPLKWEKILLNSK